MYHLDIWDEDKLNFHPSGYTSSKLGNISTGGKDSEYHKHEKYNSKDEHDSVYSRNHNPNEEDKDKKETLSESEEEKKPGEIKEEDIPVKAAAQIFRETNKELNASSRKSNKSSIEEAIQKAIKEEKELIILDNK